LFGQMHVSTPAVSAAIGAAGKGINVRVPIIRCQYAGHTTLSSGFGVMYPVSYWPHLGSCGTHLNYFSHPPKKQKPLEFRAGPAFSCTAKSVIASVVARPNDGTSVSSDAAHSRTGSGKRGACGMSFPPPLFARTWKDTTEASAVDKPGHPIPSIPLQQAGPTCWHDSSDRGICSNTSSLPYTAPL